MNVMSQHIARGAVHDPSPVAAEDASPVVATEVSVSPRPTCHHQRAEDRAELAAEQPTFEFVKRGMVQVLKADRDRQTARIPAAAIIASTSSTHPAAGFSHSTALPAFKAARVYGRCRSIGKGEADCFDVKFQQAVVIGYDDNATLAQSAGLFRKPLDVRFTRGRQLHARRSRRRVGQDPLAHVPCITAQPRQPNAHGPIGPR